MPTIPVLEGAAAVRWVAERGQPRVDRDAREAVAAILADVRRRGDAAVREYTERFDGASPSSLRVSRTDRAEALRSLASERRTALEAARANLEAFHAAQRREEVPVEVEPGITVWREFRPIARVGIYVPGGRADYPSTVLMCGVPARLAGCPEIIVCVPPDRDGRAPDSVLAAAELLELDGVYTVGGAQAIAAMAYGTESIPRVDKIVGPGNRYVTAAKELVYGDVDIDMPAGPSEIVVLADDSANPAWVAADLISQAEHAPDALAVGLFTDARTARAVADELDRQLDALPEPATARSSLADSALCVAPNLAAALDWVAVLAPEHLEIITRDPANHARRITHAGSVFVGPYSPVASGDYATGSNHVLPTGRRSRAWSALALDDFGRWIQFQRLSEDGLRGIRETITTLARWEGFEAHARAVETRFRELR